MKKMNPRGLFIIAFATWLTACTNTPEKEKPVPDSTTVKIRDRHKPPAAYQDTLSIEVAAAVFYHPDSLQLQKIKEITAENIFDSQVHEFFFQMRNARMVLKKNRPYVKIIEAKNVRYLLFRKAGNYSVCIDLDTKNDPFGLFLFEPQKDPHPADMMNIDTEVPSYFVK